MLKSLDRPRKIQFVKNKLSWVWYTDCTKFRNAQTLNHREDILSLTCSNLQEQFLLFLVAERRIPTQENVQNHSKAPHVYRNTLCKKWIKTVMLRTTLNIKERETEVKV